jgi:catechol 2,3-dioxygenase-like lactoylglutathione lyase family enzyme
MQFQVHHIALTAGELSVTSPFYDAVLAVFGYNRHNSSEKVHSWSPPEDSNNMPELLIYAAKKTQRINKHSIYDPGAHHYCFRVSTKEEVDRVFEVVTGLGGEVLDTPMDYPSYSRNVGSSRYYAVFVRDPDGIKLEFAWMPKT